MPVFIQSKIPPRQAKAKYPGEDCHFDAKIDVTSGQRKLSPDRLAFSPMTETGYKGFHCFENFWQSGKRFKALGHLDDKKKKADIIRWKGYNKPYRRHPDARGQLPVDAVYPDVTGDMRSFNYIESRKNIYVPLYQQDILLGPGSDRVDYWKDQLSKGKTIIVVDYDGPKEDPDVDADPEVVYQRPCVEVTLDLLRNKINDPRYQFGHGYVVAAELLGIPANAYTGHLIEEQTPPIQKTVRKLKASLRKPDLDAAPRPSSDLDAVIKERIKAKLKARLKLKKAVAAPANPEQGPVKKIKAKIRKHQDM